MATWGKWVAIVGGALAVISQFWGPGSYYLSLIGGLAAIVGGFASD